LDAEADALTPSDIPDPYISRKLPAFIKAYADADDEEGIKRTLAPLISQIWEDGYSDGQADDAQPPPFPALIMSKLWDFVANYDEFTTSDLQGAIGALAISDPSLDSDEMLEWVIQQADNIEDAKKANKKEARA
jgi:hypothetical protein